MAVDTKDGRTPEQRLRLIEDRFEIYNRIASHPPSADTGAGNYTASVWTEDGVFDRGAEFALQPVAELSCHVRPPFRSRIRTRVWHGRGDLRHHALGRIDSGPRLRVE